MFHYISAEMSLIVGMRRHIKGRLQLISGCSSGMSLGNMSSPPSILKNICRSKEGACADGSSTGQFQA